jgi:hypothetical protein
MKNITLTREEVERLGKTNVFPYSVSSAAYQAMAAGRFDKVKLFHSDVYYVRAALEKNTGFLFPLPAVESAMKAEGWRSR